MGNIADFLDEIERLAYKILLWVLLLPKTLLKIILEPNWVPGYVKEELSGESKAAFDRYMSPVVLFLIVTLIPTMLLSFIPTVGITVPQPEPYSEEDLRDIMFTVDGHLVSSTARVYHKVWWEVWQVNQFDQAGTPLGIEYGYDAYRSIIYVDENGKEFRGPTFTFVHGELHDEVEGEKSFSSSKSGERNISDEQPYPSQINLLNNNTIEDYFYYFFPEGEYQIRVTVENYDPNNGNLIETVSDIIYATVPADVTQNIYFDSINMVYGEEEVSGTAGSESTKVLEILKRSIESGAIYLLAIGLLSLPLLFSFGTKILGEEGLSETSLKKSFYMQCYYFSPVTAVFWALIYSIVLYTSDIYGLAVLMPIVIFLLIIIWFLNAENNAIMTERGISKGRAWGILFVLMAVLLGGFFLIYRIISDLDFLRRYSIALYPLVGVGVLIAYIVKRRRERLANKQKPAEPGEQVV